MIRILLNHSHLLETVDHLCLVNWIHVPVLVDNLYGRNEVTVIVVLLEFDVIMNEKVEELGFLLGRQIAKHEGLHTLRWVNLFVHGSYR